MDFFAIFAQYGITGLIVAVLIIIIIAGYKLDKRMGPLEVKVKEQDVRCDDCTGRRKEHFSNAFNRIEKLERNDDITDGNFKVIDTKLDYLTDNMKKMVDFYMGAGLNK